MELKVLSTLLLFLSSPLPLVQSLKCLSCQDVNVNSDNVVVNTAYSIFSHRNPDCITSDVSAASPDVELETCPTPSAGKVAKCALINGRLESSLGFITFSLTIRARTCVEVDRLTGDTCRAGHSDVEDKGFITQILSVVKSISVDSYQGTTCFCSYDACVSGQNKMAPGIVTWCIIFTFVTLQWSPFFD